MDKTFKPYQQNQKQHVLNIKYLAQHLLKLAEEERLFKNESNLQEIGSEGEIRNYPSNKFNLPIKGSLSKKAWNGTTKAVCIQSPQKGAYAFTIQTGRDFTANVYCTKKSDNQTYVCEGYFYRVGRNTVKQYMGIQSFLLNPQMCNQE